MSLQGPFTLFQSGILHLQNANINLEGGGLKAVLLTSAQALANNFVGASGDCRYSDLTAELATASGYTAGGMALSGVTHSIVGSAVKFTANPLMWTLSASITFKYLAIYDNVSTNKNLLCFTDFDTTGGSVSPVAGSLVVTPDTNGIFQSA